MTDHSDLIETATGQLSGLHFAKEALRPHELDTLLLGEKILQALKETVQELNDLRSVRTESSAPAPRASARPAGRSPRAGDSPTRTVSITATWRTVHEIEVPEDFVDTGHHSDFPDGSFDQIVCTGAELVDWDT